MRVHLYTLCWNEVDILPFFFRHYDDWVDRYVVHDDGSTDGSLEVLRAHPKVEIRSFDRVHPDSFVLSHQEFHNEVWKESRGAADWVVITALDEHLQANGSANRNYLAECARQGVTAIPAIGFQMISEDFPAPFERLAASRTLGAPWKQMNKLSIFHPDAVLATRYAAGRHSAKPIGDVRWPARDEMMLLHYKYMGFERTLQRHREEAVGLGATDRTNRWGHRYHWSAEQLRADWDSFRACAVDIGQAGFKPWLVMPSSDRWWRGDGFVDVESQVNPVAQPSKLFEKGVSGEDLLAGTNNG